MHGLSSRVPSNKHEDISSNQSTTKKEKKYPYFKNETKGNSTL
jgi:hypothetical protein